MPAGEDPDSLIKKNPKKFAQAIKNSKNAMEFYFSTIFSGMKEKLSIEEKRAVTKELLPLIKKINDPVIQGEYIQKLANRIDTPEKYLHEAMAKITLEPTYFRQPKEKKQVPPKNSFEEMAISALIAFPNIAKDFISKLSPADFNNEVLGNVYNQVEKLYNKSTGFDIGKVKKNLPSNFSPKLDLMLLKIQNDFSDLSDKEIFQEIGLLISRIKSAKFDQIKKEFEEKIRLAETKGDREKVKKLIKGLQVKIIEEGRL